MFARVARRHFLSAAAVMVVAAAVTASSVAADLNAKASDIALGSANFAGEYGKGFGEVKPDKIYNGGTVAGLVKKIKWKHWGDQRARGKGRGYTYKPEGGIYDETVGVRLRASRISSCPGNQERAYTKLKARFQQRPGGPYGDWFKWAGANSIC